MSDESGGRDDLCVPVVTLPTFGTVRQRWAAPLRAALSSLLALCVSLRA
ncbi:hypothetical protein [Sphingomonas sp. 28-62-20]